MSLVNQLQSSNVSLLGSAPDFMTSPSATERLQVVFSSQTGATINQIPYAYDIQDVPSALISRSAWSPSGTYLCLALGTTPFYKIFKRTGCRIHALTGLPAFVGTSIAGRPAWIDGDNQLLIPGNDGTNPMFTLTRSGDVFTRITSTMDFLPSAAMLSIAVNSTNDVLLINHDYNVTGVNHNMTSYTRTPATNNWVRASRFLIGSSSYNGGMSAFNPANPLECTIMKPAVSGADRTLITVMTQAAGIFTTRYASIGVVSSSTVGSSGDLVYTPTGSHVIYTRAIASGTSGANFQVFEATTYTATVHTMPQNRLYDLITFTSNPKWFFASSSSTATNDYAGTYSISSSGVITLLDRWERTSHSQMAVAPGANFAYGTSFLDQMGLLFNGDPLVTYDGVMTEMRFNTTSGATAYNQGYPSNELVTVTGAGLLQNQAGPTGGTEGPNGLNRSFYFSGTVANQDRLTTQGNTHWSGNGANAASGMAVMIVKPETPVGTKGTLWSNGMTTGTNKGLLALNVYASNGELEVMARAAALGERARRFTGFNICDGNWHFIVVTQLNDGTGVHLWVDGVEKTAFTDTTSGTVPTINHWFPTSVSTNNGGTLMGTVDIAVLPNHEGKGTVTYFGVVNTTDTSKLGSTYIKTLDAQLTF